MKSLAVIAVLLAACAGLAAGRAHEDEADVVELTAATLAPALLQHSLALVHFYSPSAETAEHPFRPAYASVATFVRALNASVLVAKVDGETEAAAARRHGLQALPALVWFVDGKEEAQFPGEELTGRAVLQWARKLVGAPAAEVRSLAELEAAGGGRLTMVGAFAAYAGEAYEAYMKLALEEQGVDFLQTTDAGVAASLGIDALPGFAVTRNYSDLQAPVATGVYREGRYPPVPGPSSDDDDEEEIGDEGADGSDSKPAAVKAAASEGDDTGGGEGGPPSFFARLEAFFYAEKLPDYLVYADGAVEALGAMVSAVPVGMHVYVVAPAEQVAPGGAVLAAVQQAGQELRGRAVVLVAALQPGSRSPLYEFLEMDSRADHAQAVAAHVVTAHKFKFAGGEVTAAALVEFVGAVEAGSAQRIYSSAPAPAAPLDADGVAVVVGSTYDAIVKDPTKDVLLEVYAPWCGYCQQLAPEYARLAGALAGVDSLVLAKVDKDDNEHADLDAVEALPTLLFYPAEEGAKAVAVDVEDPRDLQAVLDFLVQHARIPFEPPTLAAAPVEEGEAGGGDDEDDDDEYAVEEEEEHHAGHAHIHSHAHSHAHHDHDHAEDNHGAHDHAGHVHGAGCAHGHEGHGGHEGHEGAHDAANNQADADADVEGEAAEMAASRHDEL